MKWVLSALLLLLAGALLQWGSLVYAMYALIGVMLVSRLLTRAWTGAVRVERRVPIDAAAIGDTTTVEVVLRHARGLAVPWLLVEDALPGDSLTATPPRLRASGARIGLFDLRAGEERRLTYQLEFLARGYYQIGPLLIESGDLFGLHRRYQVQDRPRFVSVPPKVIPIFDYDIASRRPIGEVRLTHRLYEDPTRISGVRAYQLGDPLNRIHWRATARTGVLQSKTFEPTCLAGATIVLDFHQASYKGRGESYRAELAAVTAASLANALCVARQPVGLISNGRDASDRIREQGWTLNYLTRDQARRHGAMSVSSDRLLPIVIPTRKGEEQMDPILSTLARLEWTDGLTFAETVQEVGGHLPRDSSVIAILPEVSIETAVALGDLRRRGFAVTAVLVTFDEPDLSDWAQAPDWAARLMAEGIDFRRVADEEGVTRLCSQEVLL